MRLPSILFGISVVIAAASALPSGHQAAAGTDVELTARDSGVSGATPNVYALTDDDIASLGLDDLTRRSLLSSIAKIAKKPKGGKDTPKQKGDKGTKGQKPKPKGSNKVTGTPTKACQCGGKNGRAFSYPPAQMIKAAEAAKKNVDTNKKVGNGNTFPKRYGYLDSGVKLGGGCNKGDELYEFPLMQNGIFTNSFSVRDDALSDRVIIKQKGKETIFCGAITHLNAEGNGFNSCAC